MHKHASTLQATGPCKTSKNCEASNHHALGMSMLAQLLLVLAIWRYCNTCATSNLLVHGMSRLALLLLRLAS